MSKPTPLSGFPEWLPRQRMVEQRVLDRLRHTFELYGFAPIETRAVEPLDQLLRKGETDKEIYLLRRLQAEADEPDSNLGLHFDLTVPFARYVLENAGKLVFPFRRYQIQKVWRGERPQEGRFREFYQADIDIVNRDELPFHYDVEIALVIADALSGLPIPPIRIHVSNRKIAEGFYRGLGLTDVTTVLRIVDKTDKIGPARVQEQLVEFAGATEKQADLCLELAQISGEDFADRVLALGVRHELLDEGLQELTQVVEATAAHAPGLLIADLKIARGLDYYTGTVYETTLLGHEQLGSICSGGRYENLASTESERYPGVGISVGVSRLLARLFNQGLIDASRQVPTCVLVALPSEEVRRECDRIAAVLRRRGIPTEVSPTAAKYGKQIRYADRRGIPFVLFPGEADEHEIKDIRSGAQTPIDINTWEPSEEDRFPRIVTSQG